MRRSLLILGAVVAGWTMLGIPAHATYGARVTADEPQYLLTALSLGDDGDLDISDELESQAYHPFHRVDVDPQTYPLDEAGRQISPHDPLLPAILAFPMQVGGWVAAKATLAILAAALAMLTAWTAVKRFNVRSRIAFLVVGAFACTAPMATYATQIYPEIPAALAVMIVVSTLTGALDRRPTRRGRDCRCSPAVAVDQVRPCGGVPGGDHRMATARSSHADPWGCCVTGCRWCRVPRCPPSRSTAAGRRSPVATTSLRRASSASSAARRTTSVGRDDSSDLLVDDSFGISAWMMGWLALPFAVGMMSRRRPANWVLLMAPLLTGWLTATFVASTMHGWWWPGRQLVVVLPLAVIAIAMAADRSPALCRFLDRRRGAGCVHVAVDDRRGDHATAGARRRLRPDDEPVDSAVATRSARWTIADLGRRSPHCLLDCHRDRIRRSGLEAPRHGHRFAKGVRGK